MAFSKYKLYTNLCAVAARVVVQLVATSVVRLAWTVLPKPMYHLGGMSAARMTTILRKAGKIGATDSVVGLSSVPIKGGALGAVSRVTLEYSPARPAGAPETVVVKAFGTKLGDYILATIFPMAVMEHRCYETFGQDPDVAPIMPEVYAAHCNAFFGMLVVVMEDLQHLRFKSSMTTTATKDEARVIMRALGRYHAATWNNTKLIASFKNIPQPFLDQVFPGMATKLLASGKVDPYPRFKKTLEDIMTYDGFDALLREFRGYGVAATSEEKKNGYASPCVLIHGDVRLENMFFDDANNSVKLIDWQIPMARKPTEDLVLVMQDMDPDVATDPKQMKELFQVYCDALAASRLGRSPVAPDDLLAAVPGQLRMFVLRWTYGIVAIMDNSKQAAEAVDMVKYVQRCDKLMEVYSE